MSRERRLYFGAKPPTTSQVRAFLVDYCGGAAKRIYWQHLGCRYYVTLIGAPSRATRRVRHHSRASRWMDPDLKSRWIEVFAYPQDLSSSKSLPNYGVITRHADEFTNDVADGIATRLACAYGGRMEPDG